MAMSKPTKKSFTVDFVMDCPDTFKVMLFLQLPGGALNDCRVVSKAWRKYIDNYIMNHEGVRPELVNRLEANWRNNRCTVTETLFDLQVPCFVDGISSKYVGLRTPINWPLQVAQVSVVNAVSNEFWNVPELFRDIPPNLEKPLPHFVMTLSDSLLAVRVFVSSAPYVENLQVWSLETKEKVVNENIQDLSHFHCSQTNENTDMLILFTNDQLELWNFSVNPPTKVRVAVDNTKFIGGSYVAPFILQNLMLKEETKEPSIEHQDNQDNEENAEGEEEKKFITRTQVVVWRHSPDRSQVVQQLSIDNVENFFRDPDGQNLMVEIQDTVYLGGVFLVTGKTGGGLEVECLTIMIVGDDGMKLKECKLRKYNPNSLLSFFLYSNRLVISAGDDVLICNLSAAKVKDPDSTEMITFSPVSSISGHCEILMRRFEATTVRILHLHSDNRLKLQLKTHDFWTNH